MNATTPFSTAIVRGLYNALGAGGVALLTTYQVTHRWEDALIVGGITALGALGFRGGAEGLYDSGRDKAGKVSAGDVGQG